MNKYEEALKDTTFSNLVDKETAKIRIAFEKAKALDRALELIKQRVKNADLQLERNYKRLDELNHKVCSTAVEMEECEEEKRRISEIYNLRLREEIDTYNDCIMLIIMSQVEGKDE